MRCLPDSMHLYMTYLFIICFVLTENGSFEELPTAPGLRHSIEFLLNRVNERFNVKSGTGYLVTRHDRVLYILTHASSLFNIPTQLEC